MREHVPHAWQVVKDSAGYRLFVSWNDGSWRLLSGIEQIFDEGHHYRVINESGTEYLCKKDMNGIEPSAKKAFFDVAGQSGLISIVELPRLQVA